MFGCTTVPAEPAMGRPAARLKPRPGVWVLTLLPGLRHDYPSLRTTQGIQMAVGTAAVGTRTPSGGLRSVSTVDALIGLPSCPCVASATPVDGWPARGTTIGPRLGALDNLGTL